MLSGYEKNIIMGFK